MALLFLYYFALFKYGDQARSQDFFGGAECELFFEKKWHGLSTSKMNLFGGYFQHFYTKKCSFLTLLQNLDLLVLISIIFTQKSGPLWKLGGGWWLTVIQMWVGGGYTSYSQENFMKLMQIYKILCVLTEL